MFAAALATGAMAAAMPLGRTCRRSALAVTAVCIMRQTIASITHTVTAGTQPRCRMLLDLVCHLMHDIALDGHLS